MINILLVEKNIIFYKSLTKFLKKDKNLNVVGICKEGNNVMEFLRTNLIDVVVIDPIQSNGFVITAQIKKEFPTIKVISYSIDGEKTMSRMVGVGVVSYLSKYESNIEDLILEIKS
jgi:DNA-binding NarL/FixJ family response regulator